MPNDLMSMTLPRFGGQNVLIRATDSKLWIDGAHEITAVLPVGQIFSNAACDAACDKLNHQVVLETSIVNNHTLGIIGSLTPRHDMLGDNPMTLDMKVKHIFSCTMTIVNNTLVVKVGDKTAEFPLG